MKNHHSVDHVINSKLKMASRKKISDYFSTSVSKPAFEGASNTIDLIDSSDGIYEEEDATEILRDIVDSEPASSHENERINYMSEDATNQSNCSSDGESVESNADEDVSNQVKVSVPCPSDCACMCKGCADLSISNQLKDVEKSKLVHSHNSKERQNCKKPYCRKIQSSWYNKYPWITVCSSRYKIFL